MNGLTLKEYMSSIRDDILILGYHDFIKFREESGVLGENSCGRNIYKTILDLVDVHMIGFDFVYIEIMKEIIKRSGYDKKYITEINR